MTGCTTPNGTVSNTYDYADRRTQRSLTGTGNWTYSYDSGNRQTSTTNPYSETTSTSYDAANRVTQVTAGNTSVTLYGYDNLNRTTDVWHKTSGGTTLGRYQYTYDNASNVTQRDDNDGSSTAFGYDGANQLTSEARTGGSNYSISYTYDHNGNRLTKVQGGVTDSYSYGNHDQLTSTSTKSFSYDNNGNCTAVTVGGNTTSLTYDFENRVTGITYPNSSTNSFQYNGLGLRTQKVDSAGTFNYVCDGTTPASAVLSDSAAIYTPGLSERRSSTSKFYHGDALSSTRGITNSSQTATDSKLFDAFGMTVSSSGSTPTPFGFVGGAQYQTDSDSGLMLLGHRYYDASVGRFISQDPIGDGDNWYAYCDNDPLSQTDPYGLQGDKKGRQNYRPTNPNERQDLQRVYDDWKRRGSPSNEKGEINKKLQRIKQIDKENGDRRSRQDQDGNKPTDPKKAPPVTPAPTPPVTTPEPSNRSWLPNVDWGLVAIVTVVVIGVVVAPHVTAPALLFVAPKLIR